MSDNAESGPSSRPLELEEYERYGRQMILPGWGIQGQLKLKAARVAVVGAGGLGCPVLQYLAGAGVGTIEIFDHDTVSVSNLHRQVLHTTDRVGMNKADSVAIAMRNLNPFVKTTPHDEPITPSNALSLLASAQIIIDCTDRPLTRYLLADAAVRLDVPLVSGAAIASAGQWAVYGGYLDTARSGSLNSSTSGPGSNTAPSEKDTKGKRRACYRCIWPQIIPGSSGRCEDVGVWGVVTGLVGTGMASEVLKLIMGNYDEQPLLHLLHLNQAPLIRTVRMKMPSPKCIACGPNATITDDLDAVGYEAFCGGVEVDEESGKSEGAAGERISVQELSDLMLEQTEGVIIVDTRSEVEYEICSLPNTENIPLKDIKANSLRVAGLTGDTAGTSSRSRNARQVIFLCKQGNDSQLAARTMRREMAEEKAKSSDVVGFADDLVVKDVRGGLRAWSEHVDPTFPLY